MLLGHGCSSAGQQVLNKDIQYKLYSEAELKKSAGAEADRITDAEGHVMSAPMA